MLCCEWPVLYTRQITSAQSDPPFEDVLHCIYTQNFRGSEAVLA